MDQILCHPMEHIRCRISHNGPQMVAHCGRVLVPAPLCFFHMTIYIRIHTAISHAVAMSLQLRIHHALDVYPRYL